MTEEEFEQEVQFYQQVILEAPAHVDPYGYWNKEISTLSARFKALAQEDRTHARQLSLRLLEDERRDLRLGAITLLGTCKIRDDAFSMLLIGTAFKHKDLRKEALLALYGVRTRRVLPQLLLFADKGYKHALYMVKPMLQTPEEIEQGIAIAHKYIAADDYELREAALFLLQKHSTMEREAEIVLPVVQKYTDELFIDALKEAPPEVVLEPLKVLRSKFPERSAEYGDLSFTINALEQKRGTLMRKRPHLMENL
jgi:hypothetical protein